MATFVEEQPGFKTRQEERGLSSVQTEFRRVGDEQVSAILTGTSWLLQLRPGDVLRFFDPRPELSGGSHDLGSATVVTASPFLRNSTVAVLLHTQHLDLNSANAATARVYCDDMAAPGFIVRNTSVFAARRWG